MQSEQSDNDAEGLAKVVPLWVGIGRSMLGLKNVTFTKMGKVTVVFWTGLQLSIQETTNDEFSLRHQNNEQFLTDYIDEKSDLQTP